MTQSDTTKCMTDESGCSEIYSESEKPIVLIPKKLIQLLVLLVRVVSRRKIV